MKPTPFRFSVKFFRWFCNQDLLPSIEGDLLELFEENIKTKGVLYAKWLFLFDVIKLLRPDIIRSRGQKVHINRLTMISNYIKIGWRNIIRQRQFSILNVIGLSIGITSSLLVFLYVHNELSYDTYHSQLDRIFRVLHAYGKEEPTAPEDYQVWGGAPVAPMLLEEFPEVESFCRFTSPNIMLLEHGDNRFQEDNILFADSSVFEMFSWNLVEGNPATALKEPNAIVLTQTMAQKYFGKESALGKVIKIDHRDLATVTGVMEDVPSQSQFTFDALISMVTFHQMRPNIFGYWGYVDFYTYLKLNEPSAVETLKEKTKTLYGHRIPENVGAARLDYEPMKGAYLNSVAGRQPGPVGNMTNVYMISCIGIFILVIACVNFINLTTARSVERAKEVGVRKTLGARRGDLAFQFLAESVLITLFSFILAVVTIIFLSPYLSQLVGKQIAHDVLLTWHSVLILIGLTLSIGVVAGLYPSWILTRFKPTEVLKGKYKSSRSGSNLRRFLVVFQFSLATLLIIATTVVYYQLQYLKNQDRGFTEDQILVIDFGWDNKVQDKIQTLKNEYLTHPDVISASASRAVPGDFFPNAHTGIEDINGGMRYHGPAIYEVDEDFVSSFGMEMAAGRSFSHDFLKDSIQSLMINEAALGLYGYSKAEDIIGKKFSQWGRNGKVVGVIKNFNYKSLHNSVEPLAVRYAQARDVRKLSLRIKTSNMNRSHAEIKEIWNTLVPERPFNSTYLNQSFNAHYQTEVRFGLIFGTFASVAIFVACLGLFGLTIYITEQRTKEIGIRKVLGASAMSIMKLISKEFLTLIFLATLIAIPISWLGMNQWLEGFAYRIRMSPGLFFTAVLFTGLMAMVTVSWQTISAALKNPVDVIKDE